MRPVGNRSASPLTTEVQPDASAAFDFVMRSAVWSRRLHAAGEGPPRTIWRGCGAPRSPTLGLARPGTAYTAQQLLDECVSLYVEAAGADEPFRCTIPRRGPRGGLLQVGCAALRVAAIKLCPQCSTLGDIEDSSECEQAAQTWVAHGAEGVDIVFVGRGARLSSSLRRY